MKLQGSGVVPAKLNGSGLLTTIKFKKMGIQINVLL